MRRRPRLRQPQRLRSIARTRRRSGRQQQRRARHAKLPHWRRRRSTKRTWRSRRRQRRRGSERIRRRRSRRSMTDTSRRCEPSWRRRGSTRRRRRPRPRSTGARSGRRSSRPQRPRAPAPPLLGPSAARVLLREATLSPPAPAFGFLKLHVPASHSAFRCTGLQGGDAKEARGACRGARPSEAGGDGASGGGAQGCRGEEVAAHRRGACARHPLLGTLVPQQPRRTSLSRLATAPPLKPLKPLRPSSCDAAAAATRPMG